MGSTSTNSMIISDNERGRAVGDGQSESGVGRCVGLVRMWILFQMQRKMVGGFKQRRDMMQ